MNAKGIHFFRTIKAAYFYNSLLPRLNRVDLLTGKYISYGNDGDLEYERLQRNNNSYELINYYATGKIKDISYVVKNVRNGIFKSYHENGQKESEYMYNENGFKNGPYTRWYSNGNVACSGEYINGEKINHIYFDEYGNYIWL